MDDAAAFSDEELAELALAADPDAPLEPDAVPIGVYLAGAPAALLPSWYMAPVMARHGGRWRGAVVLAVIAAFLVIEALGLCSTYGQLPL
ncbi:MAG: hypothetical protein ACYDA2_08705 [Acidimicrobiales bacterium]